MLDRTRRPSAFFTVLATGLCFAVALVVTAQTARAQAPGSPQPAPTAPPAAPPGPATPATPAGAPAASADPAPEYAGVPAGVVADANSGRVFVTPTALTSPAGTWALNSYELVFLGLTYSLTDRFSISLTTFPPITDDIPLILLGSAKLKLLESNGWHFAATASLGHVSEGGDGATGALLGGALTRCFDEECHSTGNLYAAGGFALDPDADQSTVPVVVSLGLTQRISDRVKLLLEGNFGLSTAGEFEDLDNGFLLFYGARITSQNLGVDLGFARPVCGEDCDGDLVLGIPWVGLSYRPL